MKKDKQDKIYLCQLNTAYAECDHRIFMWDYTLCKLKNETMDAPTKSCPYAIEKKIQD